MDIREQTKADPSIIERTIFEMLQGVGLYKNSVFGTLRAKKEDAQFSERLTSQ